MALRTALRKRLANPARAGVRSREVVVGIRALIDSLPPDARKEVVTELKRELRTWTAPEPLRLQPGEAESEAEMAIEILGQDTMVRRRTAKWPAPRWRQLVRCFHDYVYERLKELEDKEFDSKEDLDRAVGDIVMDTVKEIGKDPERWKRRHCRRRTTSPLRRR